jgi:hypothetical protein
VKRKKKPIRRFAQGTKVPVESSRAELEGLVTKHGATAFMSAWDGGKYTVLFELNGRRLRFDVPAPTQQEFRRVTSLAAEKRRRWRALLLIVKAKLELVASGDTDFDAEFLAYMTITDGSTTVGQRILPHLEQVLLDEMPPLLPQGG